MPLIHRKKPTETPPPPSEELPDDDSQNKSSKNHKKPNGGTDKTKWSCVDSCCWFIGCVCVTWWFLLFLYNAMPASFPQYVTEAITGPLPDPPGVKLKKEGLKAKHPVVFIPGIVTGGLELWEGKQCADGLFRKRLWGGTFGEVYKRIRCESTTCTCERCVLNRDIVLRDLEKIINHIKKDREEFGKIEENIRK